MTGPNTTPDPRLESPGDPAPETFPVVITAAQEFHRSEDRGALIQVFAEAFETEIAEAWVTETPVNERFSQLTLHLEGIHYLERIFIQIRRAQIVESVRQAMLATMDPPRVRLELNKQAAFVGKIHLAEPDQSPLGNLEVTLEADDVGRLVDWLAPPTERGLVLEAKEDLRF